MYTVQQKTLFENGGILHEQHHVATQNMQPGCLHYLCGFCISISAGTNEVLSAWHNCTAATGRQPPVLIAVDDPIYLQLHRACNALDGNVACT